MSLHLCGSRFFQRGLSFSQAGGRITKKRNRDDTDCAEGHMYFKHWRRPSEVTDEEVEGA
jgi:hypothetical protein